MKARTLILTTGALVALAGPSAAFGKNGLSGHGGKTHTLHKALTTKVVPGMPGYASGAAAVAFGAATVNFQGLVDAK